MKHGISTDGAGMAGEGPGLLPGDVLLMLSAGDFSTLVAWLGESEYSHAALKAGNGVAIEAITAGVVESRLDDLLRDDSILRIDAFRGTAYDGGAMSMADRLAVVARAQHYMGTPFAKSGLVLLGLLAAVRKELDIPDPVVRGAVKLALRLIAPGGDRKLVCSELVYRSLRECEVVPKGGLRPVILERVPNPSPMPEIDRDKLWKEIRAMLGFKSISLVAGIDPDGALPSAGVEELALEHAAVRAALGLDTQDGWKQVGAIDRGPREIANPVPRLVRPRDLEVSPSLRLHARLK